MKHKAIACRDVNFLSLKTKKDKQTVNTFLVERSISVSKLPKFLMVKKIN